MVIRRAAALGEVFQLWEHVLSNVVVRQSSLSKQGVTPDATQSRNVARQKSSV
jgi:hypothetical protein